MIMTIKKHNYGIIFYICENHMVILLKSNRGSP